jgi:hypothetical protein
MTPAERRRMERIVARPSIAPARRSLPLDLVMGMLIGLIGGARPG